MLLLKRVAFRALALLKKIELGLNLIQFKIQILCTAVVMFSMIMAVIMTVTISVVLVAMDVVIVLFHDVLFDTLFEHIGEDIFIMRLRIEGL